MPFTLFVCSIMDSATRENSLAFSIGQVVFELSFIYFTRFISFGWVFHNSKLDIIILKVSIYLRPIGIFECASTMTFVFSPKATILLAIRENCFSQPMRDLGPTNHLPFVINILSVIIYNGLMNFFELTLRKL